MKTKVLHLPIKWVGHANVLDLRSREVKGGELYESFIFNIDAIYDIGEDQGDWNKLTGIASEPFNSKRNSIMAGWRYYIGNLDFTIYCHDENGKVHKEDENVLSVPLTKGTIYHVVVRINSSRVKVSIYDVVPSTLGTNIPFTAFQESWVVPSNVHIFDKCRRITSWFGGNRTPNKAVKIYEI